MIVAGSSDPKDCHAESGYPVLLAVFECPTLLQVALVYGAGLTPNIGCKYRTIRDPCHCTRVQKKDQKTE